jgi:N-acetylglucosamine-6-sulfatase
VLLAIAIALATLVGLGGSGSTTGQSDAPASPQPSVGSPGPSAETRPDIIVVYLDDVSPHDGRLWTNRRRTPTLARLFVEEATTFDLAISETPLCCPARATLLTGLHTSAHGVDQNDVRLFDPSVTLATELDAVGYETIIVGKYMNGLRDGVRRRDVADYAVGWDAFDVVYHDNGRYVDYDLWTRDGIVTHGRRPADHSTRMVERRTVAHLRATAPDTPVFAVMSMYDLHSPNRSQARFDGVRACRRIDPWSPPSYNERDVSDKPRYVQERERLKRREWSMTEYCEQMLGVDRAVAGVLRAQERRGRAADTLFIFTSDNGATWGAHRLGQMKSVPYATPVPLAMRWEARWGTEPRVLPEAVSNIDLAPTICAIAGCEMGPFADGTVAAHGLDLMPLLDGTVTDLGRDALREHSAPDSFRPGFRGLRTTPSNPLGRWHYVEYETDERELYDSVADPWELENVADDPAYADVAAALAERLRIELEGG